MAFWNRKPRPNAITAAAMPERPERAGGGSTLKYEEWQDEAWNFYDTLGEYRQGVTWLGNVLSRVRLVPAYAPENPGDEPEVIDPEKGNDIAIGLVADIAHGIGGQSELMRSAAVHLTVPGVGWFVGQVKDNPEAAWKFYSADEVRTRTVAGEKIWQVRASDSEWTTLGRESLPIRVWRQHDRYHWKPDSSSRAALPIMRRLELLNRRIDAEQQSRLSMNGLYWVPSEIVFPANPNYPDSEDPFMDMLMEAGITAIQTPGSAAAAMPIVNRAPGEWIDHIKYDKFHGDDDGALITKRESEIRRLATAMDVPSEVLLGMVGLNHWGAWQVEESALKTTVTNLAELVCWSLTTGYLTPALGAAAARENPIRPENTSAAPAEDGRRRIVWYDLSELTVRPDKSTTVVELHKTLNVNDAATARETGLENTDFEIPTEELKKRIGLVFVQSPQTAEAGLELLGIQVQAKITQEPGAEAVGVPAAPSTNGDEPAPPDTRDAEPASPPAAAPRPQQR